MIPVIAALSGAAVIGGLLVLVWSLVPHPPTPQRPPRSSRMVRRLRRMTRRTRILLVVGLVAGVLVFVLTGWVVAVVAGPMLIAGLPALISPPPAKTHIDQLQALEEWTRGLSGVLTAGVGLEEALRISLRSTPAVLRPQVNRLVAAIQGRKPTEQALHDFADDLDDVTGDLVASFLILGARRRGPGLSAVLQALAESVAAEVRARRKIESDRETPRTTARIVTAISVGVLALMALTHTYIAPYGSPVGQILLLIYLGIYMALLVWMRAMTADKPFPRFLIAKAPGGAR